MAKENAVALTPEQVQAYSLFIANAKLIGVAGEALDRNPKSPAILFNNQGEKAMVEIDRDKLDTLRLANFGLYNELAHPLSRQVLKNNIIVLERDSDDSMIEWLGKQLEVIQNPKNEIDTRDIFEPQ